MQFSSIYPIDRALSGATISGQSRPGSVGNEEELCIPQNFRSFSVISKTLVVGGLTPLQRCCWCIPLPQPTGQYTELMSKQS